MTWPDYMDASTLARRLDVSPGYIEQLVRRGCIPPPVKVGDARRFRWSDVDKWLLGVQHEHDNTVSDEFSRRLSDANNRSAASRAQSNGAR